MRRIDKLLLVFFSLMVICALVDLCNDLYGPMLNRIHYSRAMLISTRSVIHNYKKEYGKFPVDLAQDLAEADKLCFPEEYISNGGDNSVHKSLDGTGGWYYNPKTGELKINVTVPVSKCIPYYFGKYRNDIPSDW